MDIISEEDVVLLVNTFYDKVKLDEDLSPIFNGVIKDNWNKHLDKMYKFWQTILLNEPKYKGSPFAPHAKLPVNKSHFDKWILLFSESIDENFTGEKAEEAKSRANQMAQVFHHKIDYLRQQG